MPIVAIGGIEKYINLSIVSIVVMVNKPKVSSIQITEETKKELARLGKKGDSYEDIIKRLLNKHKD